MDRPEPPQRPWWNRKRWVVVPVLLALAYPAALGPLRFCASRRWLPYGLYASCAGPMEFSRQFLSQGMADHYDAYVAWWGRQASWPPVRGDTDDFRWKVSHEGGEHRASWPGHTLVISRKGVFWDEKRIAEAPAGTDLFEYDYRGGRLVVRADGETIATVEPTARVSGAEAASGRQP